MNILMVASEAAPYVRTGDVANVSYRTCRGTATEGTRRAPSHSPLQESHLTANRFVLYRHST